MASTMIEEGSRSPRASPGSPATRVKVVISPIQTPMTSRPGLKSRVITSAVSDVWAHGSSAAAFAFDALSKIDKNRDSSLVGVSCGGRRDYRSTSTAASSLSDASSSIDGAGAQSVRVSSVTLKLDSPTSSPPTNGILPSTNYDVDINLRERRRRRKPADDDGEMSQKIDVTGARSGGDVIASKPTIFSPDVDVPLILEKCDVIAGPHESGSESESHFVFESSPVEEEVEVWGTVDKAESLSSEPEVVAIDGPTGDRSPQNDNNTITEQSVPISCSSRGRARRTKVVTVRKTVVKKVLVKRKVSKPRDVTENVIEKPAAENDDDMKGERIITKPVSVRKPTAVTRTTITVRKPNAKSDSVTKPTISSTDRKKEGDKPSVTVTSTIRKPVTITKAESSVRKPAQSTSHPLERNPTDKDRKSAGHKVQPLASPSTSVSSPQRKTSSHETTNETELRRKSSTLSGATRGGAPSGETRRNSKPRMLKRNSVPSLPTWVPTGRRNGATTTPTPLTTTTTRRKSIASVEKRRKSMEAARKRSSSRKPESRPPSRKTSSNDKTPWNSSTRPKPKKAWEEETTTSRPTSGRKKGLSSVTTTVSPAGVGKSRKFFIGDSKDNEEEMHDDVRAVATKASAPGVGEPVETRKRDRTQLPESDLQTLRESSRLSDSDLQHMRDSAVSPT